VIDLFLVVTQQSAHYVRDAIRKSTKFSTGVWQSIISKLGAGGMGEVYLAQDAKLDRKVALKVLPSEVAANQNRMRRFVQEAKAAVGR